MSNHMKALVKTENGPGYMELLDMPVPVCKENQALIRVQRVGVCGTDLKILDGTFPCAPPVIVGHEFSGFVEAVGAAATSVKPGWRVISEQHVGACGVCRYCLTGRRHLCPSKKSPGYFSDGAYAEYIAIDASLLHRMPDSMTFDEGALMEPFAIAAHAVNGLLRPEDTVVILGCGPIAILMIQLLRAGGAGKMYVTGLDADEAGRFPIAERYGAQAVNVQRKNPVDIINENGCGADLVIDLSGVESAILQGFGMLRRGGRFCAIGMPAGTVSLPWKDIVMKAVDVHFSFSSGYEAWEQCLSLIARGAVRLDELTRNVYPLSGWRTAFEDARTGKVLKAIIRIDAS